MPGWFATLGSQVAGQAASGAVALGLQRLGVNYDMRKAQEQYKNIMGIQMEGEKEMMDYQNQKQLEMWENTNYPAQVEQMKKTNVNPALLYGGGGGGGTTTGGGVPTVSGSGAPDINTRSAIQGMGIMNAAQIELMKAQADNLNAQTNKTNAEIPNVGKTGANIEASTQSILQGITNAKAQKALTDAQARIANIQGNVAEESQDDAIQRIHSEAIAAIGEARSAMAEGNVDNATQESKIEILKQEAVGKALENALTKAQTGKTNTAIQVDKAQIQKMAADIAQGWEGLSIRMKEAKVNGVIQEYNAQYQGNVSKWLPADAQTMARQIDEILGIRPSDFKDKKK